MSSICNDLSKEINYFVSKHRVVLSHFAYTKCVFYFFLKFLLYIFTTCKLTLWFSFHIHFYFFLFFLSCSAILVYDVKVYTSTVLKQSCNKKSICSNISRTLQDAVEDKLSTAPRVIIWDFQERMAIASLRNTWLLGVSEVRGLFIKYFYFQNCKVLIPQF